MEMPEKKTRITVEDLEKEGITVGKKVLYWPTDVSVEAEVEDIVTDEEDNVRRIVLRVRPGDARYLGIDEIQEIEVSREDTIEDIVGDTLFKILPLKRSSMAEVGKYSPKRAKALVNWMYRKGEETFEELRREMEGELEKLFEYAREYLEAEKEIKEKIDEILRVWETDPQLAQLRVRYEEIVIPKLKEIADLITERTVTFNGVVAKFKRSFRRLAIRKPTEAFKLMNRFRSYLYKLKNPEVLEKFKELKKQLFYFEDVSSSVRLMLEEKKGGIWDTILDFFRSAWEKIKSFFSDFVSFLATDIGELRSLEAELEEIEAELEVA
jgi:hypothetical protein